MNLARIKALQEEFRPKKGEVTVPPLLYHFTGAEAAFGILKSGG